MEAHRDWMVVKPRTPWTAEADLRARYGARHIAVGIPGRRRAISRSSSKPAPRRALQRFFWTAGKLVLSILDELRPVFEVWTPAADGWTRATLPGLPEIGVVDVWRLDAEEAESNGDLLANIQDPVTPAIADADRGRR